MIQTLYTIGKVLSQDEQYQQYFEPWQELFPNKDKQIIILEIRNGQFIKIYTTSYNPDYKSKCLMREYPSRGSNTVPTLKWSGAKGTFNKIKQSISNNNLEFINEENLKKVEDALLEFDASKDYSYILTFKIDGKYFGEIDEYKNLFLEKVYDKYWKKSGNEKYESKSVDKICALSGERENVYGVIDTLGFTVNELSFMRNGFKRQNAYKMFPVSPDAVRLLEGTFEFVHSKIENRFYRGIKYIILPQFFGASNNDKKKEIIEKFIGTEALNINYEKKDKGLNGFVIETEDYINTIINNNTLKEQVNYEILFYEQIKAQKSLKLNLTDVRPSRFEEIFLAKREVQSYYAPITNRLPAGKKKGYTFRINLYKIKDFFMSERGSESIPHPFFYRLVEAIFCKQKINKLTVLKFITEDIRRKFKKRHQVEYAYISSGKEGFVILQFLEKLGLFNTKNQNNMENENQKVPLNALEFIEQHKKGFFEHDYIKGAFLFGCLVKRLTYNQNNDAFLKELNNLVIDKNLINRKFPKLIDKLRKYKREFKELEIPAANYFASGHSDDISKDEISMAVTLGLILQSSFEKSNNKS